MDLVKIIENGNVDDIPEIITVSVKTSSSKGEALKKMDDNELSLLPVVDDDERYMGIVDRDKLTSSILVQLVSEVN